MSAGPRRSAGVQWEEIDGDIVVFDPRRDQAFCLDRSAALLWSRLDGTKDVSALAAELAAADVRALLANLDQMGLLE